MADQEKNDQRLTYNRYACNVVEWLAGSSIVGAKEIAAKPQWRASSVRNRRRAIPHHLERADDMVGPLAMPPAQRLTTSQAVYTLHTDEERGLDP